MTLSLFFSQHAFPFLLSCFLSEHRPPSVSFRSFLFFLPFLYTFAFSRPLCGCGKLRPAYEVWDKSHVSHQGHCQGLNLSQLREIGIRWLRSHPLVCIPEDLREYWLTITQTATPHWRITPGRQRLSHRSVSPTRAVKKPFKWSHPDLLFSQRKLQIRLFPSLFPPFLLSTQTEAGWCMQRGTSPPAAGTTRHKYLKCRCSEQVGRVGGGRAVNSRVASVVLRL